MNLEEIRRVTQQATPGPWGVQGYDDDERAYVVLHHFGAGMREGALCFVPSDPIFGNTPDADAEFIALAREAIPWLLDRIERLESGCGPDDPSGCPAGHGDQCCGWHDECRKVVAAAEFAVCERTETARTPPKPTRQAT